MTGACHARLRPAAPAGRFRSSRRLTAGLVLLGLAATGWGWHLLKLQVMWAVILLAIGAFVLWRTLRGRE